MIKIAYMCKVDYDYHLEEDLYPVRVYKSVKNIKHHLKCVKTCGIVKVEIKLTEIVKEPNNE